MTPLTGVLSIKEYFAIFTVNYFIYEERQIAQKLINKRFSGIQPHNFNTT